MHQAYTDGSSLGNPGPSGWAIYLDKKPYYGKIEHATNNYAEMFAVFKAIELTPAGSDLEIVTDSKLVIGWFTRGWKINNKKIKRIKNNCDALRDMKDLKVSFVKTKGHASDQWNNRVDALARSTARSTTELPRQVSQSQRLKV
jgi:ribonuclease HI